MYDENKLKLLDYFALTILALMGIIFIATAVGHRNKIAMNDANSTTHITEEVNR